MRFLCALDHCVIKLLQNDHVWKHAQLSAQVRVLGPQNLECCDLQPQTQSREPGAWSIGPWNLQLESLELAIATWSLEPWNLEAET